jgi:hypothetical protein
MCNKLNIIKIKFDNLLYNKKKAKKYIKKYDFDYLRYYNKKKYIVFIISEKKFNEYIKFEFINGIIYKYGY